MEDLESLKRCCLPIGMFDSGIGGLTVMQEICTTLPQEKIIYFGDTARLPYGEKSQETIIRYAIENTIFLMEQKIKMLVIPCNTVSSYALENLQRIFNIPILGVIEPGVDRVVQVTKNQRIAVLGTRGTIHSGVYQNAIKKKLPGCEVFAIACPLFVPLVEERFLEHEATKMIVKDYLAPLKNEKIDTILLGCTHYPLLRDLIQEEMGKHVLIIDSATTCAQRVSEIIKAQNLVTHAAGIPRHQYFASDNPEKFRALGSHFLQNEIEKVDSPNHSFAFR